MAYNDSGLSSVHIQEALTNVMVDYVPQNMIADMIFPRVPVAKESDTYWVWDKANLEYTDNTGFLRGPESEYVRIKRTVSTDTYICKEHGAESPVGARISAEADFDADRAAVEHIAHRLMLDRELRIAAQLFSTTNITQNTTLTGTSQWDQYGESACTPIDDIQTGAETIELATGYAPNTLVLGKQVFVKLLRNPQILELIRSKEGAADSSFLSQVFGVDRILVGTGVYNSAVPDLDATYTGAYGWGKYALLAYVAPNPSIAAPSLGYQFVKRDWQVSQYEEPKTDSLIHRLSEISDSKIVAAGCGYLIAGAVS